MEKYKTGMEILNEIRNYRQNEINELGDESISIVKVEFLGEGLKTGKPFFRLIEEKEVKNLETGKAEIDEKTNEPKVETTELYFEYDNGPKLVGARSSNSLAKGEIIPIGFDGDNKENWDDEREDLERCAVERDEELKAIAKELGLDEKDINDLSEVDLAQKIQEEKEEKQEEKKEEKQEENENEPQEVSKEKMEKITGMNEVSLKAKIDERGTELGTALHLEEYSKIIVVHSYKLREMTNGDGNKDNITRNKFKLVAQKPDGTYETVPESKLKTYGGGNRKVTEINNEDNVEVKNEECVFEVPGTDKRLIISQKDPYGIPDVYFGKNTRSNDGQIAEKLQDQYDGTEKTPVEVRAIFNANRGEYKADEVIEKVQKHDEEDCDDIGIDEAGEGNPSHIHFDPDDPEQKEAIDEIVEKSAGGPDSRISWDEGARLFEEKLEEHKGEITPKEVAEKVLEDMNYRGHEKNKT